MEDYHPKTAGMNATIVILSKRSHSYHQGPFLLPTLQGSTTDHEDVLFVLLLIAMLQIMHLVPA